MIIWLFLLFFSFLKGAPVYAATEYYFDIPVEEDTYVEENFPTVSPWDNRNWYIGTDSFYGKGKTRTLIHTNFNLLREKGILPTDVSEVRLIAQTYLYEGTNTTATVDVYTTTSPWSMYTATWNVQPTITSTKKDSTVITTDNGQKIITITNAFKDAYTNTTIKRGILLKLNPENGKALIFWANSCDIAPSPPQCEPSQQPYIRVFYNKNTLPTSCTFKLPAKHIQNTSNVDIQANMSVDVEKEPIAYQARVCETVNGETVT